MNVVFVCLIQFNLHSIASTRTAILQLLYRSTDVKNWTVLLEQSFTAHVPLLTAASTFA